MTRSLLLFMALACMTPPGHARDFKFNKKVDLSQLQDELVKAGFKVHYIQCSRNDCVVRMPDQERKNPGPIIERHQYVDREQARRRERAELLALYAKWVAGTIPPQEKDELLRRLAALQLGAGN